GIGLELMDRPVEPTYRANEGLRDEPRQRNADDQGQADGERRAPDALCERCAKPIGRHREERRADDRPRVVDDGGDDGEPGGVQEAPRLLIVDSSAERGGFGLWGRPGRVGPRSTADGERREGGVDDSDRAGRIGSDEAIGDALKAALVVYL